MEYDSARGLRILCVDDDPDIRLIVELALHLDPDCHAHSVGGATEALAVLQQQDFDLLLLDALMPEIDGLTLLDHVLHDDGLAQTPVIFLTADALRRFRYQRPGVVGVISKPFDPLRLADTIRALVTNVGASRMIGY
jgi:two-component system, OmpR family, response regulator